MTNLGQQAPTVENVPIPVNTNEQVSGSQEASFENKIREIDEYFDKADEAVALLEKKLDR